MLNNVIFESKALCQQEEQWIILSMFFSWHYNDAVLGVFFVGLYIFEFFVYK